MIESVLVDSIRKISSIFIPNINIVETLRATSPHVCISIAKTADRIAVVLVVAVTVHGGVIVVQVAVPSVTAGSLRRTPKVGVVAEIVVAIAIVVAGWQRTEAQRGHSNVAFAPTIAMTRHFNWSNLKWN